MLRFWRRIRRTPEPGPRAGLFSPVVRFERSAYLEAVAVVAAKLAKSDGPVRRVEIDTFKRLFPLAPGEASVIGPLFNLARETSEGFRPFAEHLSRMLADNPSAAEELFDRFHGVALADGSLTAGECDFLCELAQVFGLEAHWEGVQGRSSLQGDPYAVLGITRDASDGEVRAAWHRLLRRFHPDAVMARGEGEADHGRVAAINTAYRRIVRLRKREHPAAEDQSTGA